MKRKIVAMLLVMSLSLLGNTAVWAGSLDEGQLMEPTEETTESDEDEEADIDEPLEPEDEKADIAEPSDPKPPLDPVEPDSSNIHISPDDLVDLIVSKNPENFWADKEDEEVAIDEKNFPDEAFREMVKGCDKDGNGNLCKSEAESVEIISGLDDEGDLTWNDSIRSVTGISYFTNLKELTCHGQIEFLSISNRKLERLDVSNASELKVLACTSTSITSLDVSSNLNLRELSCGDNQLTSLKLSDSPVLECVLCSGNRLTKLDLSGTNVKNLWCGNNPLENLIVPSTLQFLDCHDSRLMALDLSNAKNMGLRSENDGGLPGCHGPMAGAFIKEQLISKRATKVDDKWSLDLAALIGSDNIGRISLVTEGAELSDKGVVTFSGKDAPTELEYTYDTKNPAEETLMTVRVALGGVIDQTEEGVRTDTSELDLDSICKDQDIDPGKAEIIVSQETPEQKATEELTQKAKENGYSITNVYEILMWLYSEGNKVADITENFGKLTLTLQAGKNYAGYQAVVYQLHKGEEIISHGGLTVDAEGMVTITVDKFSTFAVAVGSRSSVNNSGQSSGNAPTTTDTPTTENPTTTETPTTNTPTTTDTQTITNTQNSPAPTFASPRTNTANAGSVKTGDFQDAVLWSVLCVLSVGAGLLLIRRKSCRHSE